MAAAPAIHAKITNVATSPTVYPSQTASGYGPVRDRFNTAWKNHHQIFSVRTYRHLFHGAGYRTCWERRWPYGSRWGRSHGDRQFGCNRAGRGNTPGTFRSMKSEIACFGKTKRSQVFDNVLELVDGLASFLG